ncbi:MAG: hypothetical protein SPH77_06110 [Campylobacter sp.]|uniref:hypothetical protein n=1 Tax=Campylobacter sp. TaxID=205 RepID=UPI002A575CBE|nr:hypothetical protein [Campylobacter sp.]MDD7090070.1 hypothetical protein [Campylobacteraceae bacterium]MCI6178481.1 hypothetical protein [Campylobacter sp.]MDY3245264.1 hypothetical protein [Campylobacter sp.]MDY5285289.1 hypothetical protein [Campylobacter sp.]MDY5384866.1 hypothetical protein [Campylobacter sp.]
MENDLEKLEFDRSSQRNQDFERALDKYIDERSNAEELEMMKFRAKELARVLLNGEDMVLCAAHYEVDKKHKNLSMFCYFYGFIAFILFPTGVFANFSGWWLTSAALGIVPFVNQFYWLFELLVLKTFGIISIISAVVCFIWATGGIYKSRQIKKAKKLCKVLVSVWNERFRREYYAKKFIDSFAYEGGL